MSSRSRKVQFGPFEFDLSNGELLKYGRRVRFQEQPARVLRILISRPGELVTREELRDELWPADVFTDYEHGIHRAVNRIRVTLGDTAAKPRFVETQAGRGYRFIAPISALANGSPNRANPSDDFRLNALPSSPDGVTAAQKPSRWPFRISWFATAAAAILLIVSVGLSLSRRHTTSIALHPKDFVLVASFENHTGEANLDPTLDFVFQSELRESGLVNIVPRQRVQDVLALMKKPLDTPINAELAREVCQRDRGIRAYISGGIGQIGSTYVVSAYLTNPGTGDVVFSDTERSPSRAELLSALHRLSDRMRRGLGEALPPRKKVDGRPLETVTTSSLEALKEYSDAVKYGEDGTFDGNKDRVIAPLERAVKDDPQFASAQIRLAITLASYGRDTEAAKHFQIARRLADGATPRERLFILANYDEYALDDEKAIAAYEELLRLDPDDVVTLRRLLFLTGQPSFSYRAADLRPNNIGINAWAWTAAFEKRDAPMEQKYYQRSMALWSTDALENSPGADILEFRPVLEAVNRGDTAGAQRELKKVASSFQDLGPQARNHLAFEVGNLYCYLGQLRQAQYWYSLTTPAKRNEGLAELAMARGHTRMIRLFKHDGRDPNVLAMLAMMGETLELGKFSRNAQEPAYHYVFDGERMLVEGQRDQGIAQLRKALSIAFYSDQKLAAASLLARALEEGGNISGAAEALETATSSPMLPLLNLPVWGLQAQLQLARLYRELGRTADAEAVEGGINNLLSAADNDVVFKQQLPATQAKLYPAPERPSH